MAKATKCVCVLHFIKFRFCPSENCGCRFAGSFFNWNSFALAHTVAKDKFHFNVACMWLPSHKEKRSWKHPQVLWAGSVMPMRVMWNGWSIYFNCFKVKTYFQTRWCDAMWSASLIFFRIACDAILFRFRYLVSLFRSRLSLVRTLHRSFVRSFNFSFFQLVFNFSTCLAHMCGVKLQKSCVRFVLYPYNLLFRSSSWDLFNPKGDIKWSDKIFLRCFGDNGGWQHRSSTHVNGIEIGNTWINVEFNSILISMPQIFRVFISWLLFSFRFFFVAAYRKKMWICFSL